MPIFRSLLCALALLAAPASAAPTKLTTYIAAVHELSESGDGYTFSTRDGLEFYIHANDDLVPGGRHLLAAAESGQPVCLSFAPEHGMGDIAAVAPGACAPAPRVVEPPARVVDCQIASSGDPGMRKRCVFVPRGHGSFALTDPDTHGLLTTGVRLLTVEIVEPGVAEVRGLTVHGIHARWGLAQRADDDRACWQGSDFRVCAW